jgi:Alpha/beta hydrolase of unknown function (DUF1400)
VFKPLLAGLFLGAAVSVLSSPASAEVANGLPIRWNTGGAVWSTSQAAIDTFLSTGQIIDRGLQDGIKGAGWPAEDLRAGMNKTYNVDLVAVARFLYSDAGVVFLKQATNSYFPYWSMNTYAVQALRAAIIKDAADGVISSATIMRALPTDFRLADFCNTYSGAQNICAEGRCAAGTAQCTSLLSWYVFLPACLQANQLASPLAPLRSATPAPVSAPAPQPVRGLW